MALHAWVHYVRARMLLPLRGDCNVITGGPPCQSVSGNNRNALCAPALCWRLARCNAWRSACSCARVSVDQGPSAALVLELAKYILSIRQKSISCIPVSPCLIMLK